MNEFANLFSSKRIEKGLSQGEIASMLNVTRQAVSKWENGKAMPDITLMPQIAEILGVSIEELLTGNEPKKQVEVVEKIVVQEKEIIKPMPVRKILTIVLPIVLVVVLASSLMGVYIPQAIAKNTPPPIIITPEPDPEIEYTRVFDNYKSEAEGSCFQAQLIKDKAYYTVATYFSRDYTLYFTAPKGAVITYYKLVNDPSQRYGYGVERTVIAEFDTAKTIEYKQYFKSVHYEKNSKFDVNNSNSYEYDHTGALMGLGEEILGEENNKGGVVSPANYRFVIDLSNCAEEDKLTEKQQIVLKHDYGFDNVIIPANSTYFVAIPHVTKAYVKHYGITSEGIKYVETSTLRVQGKEEDRVSVFHDGGSWKPQKPVTDFVFSQADGDGIDDMWGYYTELHMAFINVTDKAIKLEMKEIPIEEIQLGQEFVVKSDGINNRVIAYRMNILHPMKLVTEVKIGDSGSGRIAYFRNGSFRRDTIVGPGREGWRYEEDTYEIQPGEIYILIFMNGEEITCEINDLMQYNDKYSS